MKKSNFDSEAAKGRKRHREVETTQAREERLLVACKQQIYVLFNLYKKLYALLEHVFKRRVWGWNAPGDDTKLLYSRFCGVVENKVKRLNGDLSYLVKTRRLCSDAQLKAVDEPDINIFAEMKKMKWSPFEQIVNVSADDWKRSGRCICWAFLEKVERLWLSFRKEPGENYSISDKSDLELLEIVENTIKRYKGPDKDRKLIEGGKKSSTRKRVGLPTKFPTPPNTTWHMVSMQFVSEDSVKVSVKSIHRRYTFADMGFKDNRKYDSPDKQWEALKSLAKNRGELSWQKGTAISGVEKQIQGIRKRLRTFIGIGDDPFFPYRRVWCYRTKFSIEDKSCDE